LKQKKSFFLKYILGIALMFISFLSFAQSPLELKVSATFQELTLIEILDKVAQDQPFSFYYRPEDLPNQKKFSITLQETPIREMLQELLKGLPLSYFDYRFYGIVIGPKPIIEEFYTADFYKILEKQMASKTNIEPAATTIRVGDRC